MFAIVIIELSMACLILAVLLSFRYKPQISRFELKRLAVNDKKYQNQLRFLDILPGIKVLVYLLALIVAILICATSVSAWGFLGSVLAFALIILAFFLGMAFSKITKDLIEKNFAWFNKYFSWAEGIGKITLSGGEPKINSREEFMHLIETGDFIEATDKVLLLGAMDFAEKKVSDVMIVKSKIVSVKSSDIIGPKLLDELHQSGHLVFPVMKNQSIIGILHVEDVVSLDQGAKSITDFMRRVPTAISQDASLEEALQDMKNDRSCQLIVVDASDRLVGLIDIYDIINVLFKK